MSKKFGFTLAEILVTLGLIGVISAMTIPNLAYNYKAKVLEQQFRATYSDVMQISNLISRNNGDIGIYANKLSYTNWAHTFMANVTGGGSINSRAGSVSGANNITTVLRRYYKDAGAPQGPYTFYPKSATGTICDNGGIWTDNKGRIWTFNAESRIVCVDVNGTAAPNRFNIDTFAFIPMSARQVAEWVYDDAGHPNNYTGQMVLCDINYIRTRGLSNNVATGDKAHKGQGSALDACPFNEPLENIAPLDKNADGSLKEFGTSANGKKTTLKDPYWTTYINYK